MCLMFNLSLPVFVFFPPFFYVTPVFHRPIVPVCLSLCFPIALCCFAPVLFPTLFSVACGSPSVLYFSVVFSLDFPLSAFCCVGPSLCKHTRWAGGQILDHGIFLPFCILTIQFNICLLVAQSQALSFSLGPQREKVGEENPHVALQYLQMKTCDARWHDFAKRYQLTQAACNLIHPRYSYKPAHCCRTTWQQR